MFRVPFVMGKQERVCDYSKLRESKKAKQRAEKVPDSGAATGAKSRSSKEKKSGDVWGLEGRGDDIYELDGTLRSDPRKLRHLCVMREAMQYWQAFDGLARVAMSIGTNQFVTALAYYVIGYVLVSNHAVIASWLVVMLFMVLTAALVRLDMSLSARDYRISVMLMSTGPCVVAVAASQWAAKTPTTEAVAALLSPIPFVFHSMWLAWLLKILAPKNTGGAILPTGFRAVMFTDIFGWIKNEKDHEGIENEEFQPAPVPGPLDDSVDDLTAPSPGSGPAVQAACYQDCQPIPTRPEDLPGAATSPFALEGLRKEDFEPTTFVPREKDYINDSRVTEQQQANLAPGYVPWRVFCAATVLLVNLWWVSGVLALLSACNINPVMIDPHGEKERHEGESLLQLGDLMPPRRYQDGQLVRPQLLMGGEPVLTEWPNARIQAHGLACGGSGEHPALVASTRFGLYAAWLGRANANAAGPGGRRVSFEVLPCSAIQGESVQDLALGCGEAGVGCRAFVLHGQGEQLSACAVGPFLGNASVQHPLQYRRTTTRLADEWLEEANANGLSQEEVTSIAHVRPCRGGSGGHCAFVQTNRGRIVEVRMDMGADTNDAEPDWYPTHVLQASMSAMSSLHGGALHHVGGGYLGVLNAHGQLEVLNPQDGTLIGLWQLPVDQIWKSMCSNGHDLFFLADGRQPDLWRFPVPGRIRPINELWVPSFVSPEEEEAEALESFSPHYFLGYHKRHVNLAAVEEV